MKSDSTKAMQEVLQAAVARMNSGSADPAAPSDPLSLLMSVLPKLLQDNESGEEMLEKLEGLQKEDIGPLREQVQMLRKQCHRLLKSQEEILIELRELQKQQSTVNRAVLELARHMERIELIEEAPPEDEELYERDAGQPRRGFADEQSRLRQRAARNPNRERP